MKYIRYSRLLLFFVLSSGFLYGSAVKVYVKEKGDSLNFYVKNKSAVAITIDFDVKLFDLIADTEQNVFVVEAKTEKKLFSLRRLNGSTEWVFHYDSNFRMGSAHSIHDDSYRYRIPFEKGKLVEVTQGFEEKHRHSEELRYAIDWVVPEGTPVYAARGGVVIRLVEKYRKGGKEEKYRTRGNCLFVLHSDGTIGAYLHFKRKGIVVKKGDRIEAGTLVGYSGNTGYSAEPHLHFDVRVPADGKTLKTFPVSFRTAADPEVVLQRGQAYAAD
ncbi:MAG: M23 family metallopeptidase [Opitutaceae bacterium]|nr:M23 family metallopeptidase [Opitutaceae bacterium]